MSRLTELVSQIKSKDSQLGIELEKEFKALSSRRQFGLNFERHRPESVELPNRVVRKSDKVRVLPQRGSTMKGDQQLWKVKELGGAKNKGMAILESIGEKEIEIKEVIVDDLVVIAEFQDYIYPGLVSTGKVEKNPEKPFHTVINGENYHVLKALTFTHKGKIDAIYIDPPYNTGAKDWKYNNDYVESEDNYRHSKWLAFMERRLKIAKKLLIPDQSVLIISIDEKEVHRLGLLIEQTFPEGVIQMATSVISAKGAFRPGKFSRVEEHLFIVTLGSVAITPWERNMLDPIKNDDNKATKVEWLGLRRREPTSTRGARPNQFYPIFVNIESGNISAIGDAVEDDVDRETVQIPDGSIAIWPLKPDGTEMLWGLTPKVLEGNWKKGFVRINNWKKDTLSGNVQYLPSGTIDQIKNGEIVIKGHAKDNSVLAIKVTEESNPPPKRVWNLPSHNAETGGTNILSALIPGRRFPFPKSVYAIEDVLRFFIKDNENAIVLDFFAGSGTTAHAVMRLNRQDDGKRQTISITNNEVSADEQKKLRVKELRPGDDNWEKWGICDHITKPRIKAAITGKTPEGNSIEGDYKFTDEFPMSTGFDENAEFFTLTYESPIAINHNLALKHIAPLLWMRAGSIGSRIEEVSKNGWGVVEAYGLLVDLDKSSDFVEVVRKMDSLKMTYIVTNDDRRFQSVARQLPQTVEPIRLYESYLKNFQFTAE
ncbi:MAG: DNA methyltransferase [Cyclobacteriaceae bacterium]